MIQVMEVQKIGKKHRENCVKYGKIKIRSVADELVASLVRYLTSFSSNNKLGMEKI